MPHFLHAHSSRTASPIPTHHTPQMSQTITQTIVTIATTNEEPPTATLPQTEKDEHADQLWEEHADQLWEEHALLRQSSADIERKFRDIQRDREEVRRALSTSREKLKSVCDHDWFQEPPQYQERSWYSCTKCGNIK